MKKRLLLLVVLGFFCTCAYADEVIRFRKNAWNEDEIVDSNGHRLGIIRKNVWDEYEFSQDN